MSDPRVAFASTVADGDRDELWSDFKHSSLLIRIGGDAIGTAAGQVIAYQLATLWVRLFDGIAVEADEDQPSLIPSLGGPFAQGLRLALAMLRPLDPGFPHKTVIIGIGTDLSGPCSVYLGSSGWGAAVSLETPLPVEDTRNTLGALAAGTLGAAEAFKEVFHRRIRGSVDHSYTLSLLDYSTESRAEPELPDQVGLNATLFGCGSIGMGFLQAVLLSPNLTGKLNLVDNGVFEAKNFYKYPLITESWAKRGAEKSRWAADELNLHDLAIRGVPFVGTAQQYVASLPADYQIPIAVSAVDTAEARVEIQDTLPEAIVNAGITGTTAEVSFHTFGDGPCLACLSLDEERESWNPYPIASRTGLPPARVSDLIRGNLRITQADISTMIEANALPQEVAQSLLDFEGQPLLSLWNRVAYSEAVVTTSAGRPAQVTTAFVSAFAGVLLLAETIKRAEPTLRPFQVDNSYRQDLIGVPAGGPFLYERDESGQCICHSGFRERVYRRKYGRRLRLKREQ